MLCVSAFCLFLTGERTGLASANEGETTKKVSATVVIQFEGQKLGKKSVNFGEKSGFLDSMHLPNVSEGLIIEIRVQRRSKNYF